MKLKQSQKSKKTSSKIFVWTYLDEYKKYNKKILSLVDNVFRSGNLILANEVDKFEKNFSKFINCKYGIGVNSGTDAIQIALMSLNIQKNDEVITVSNTAVPTVSAIVSCNAKPILIDVNENDFLLNSDLIESKITKKTKAIIPVNLYGQSADYDKICKIAKKYKIKVIEDCAQSAGALYNNKPSGSLGDMAAFSFYPTKNLGAYGDAGMIVTNKKKLYSRSKKIRKYGMTQLYYSEIHGINSRLDEVQAAILNFKLSMLKQDIKKRRNIAKIYQQNIKCSDLILPVENKKNFHSYYVYVVRHKKRKKIMNYLKKNDIFCNISYPFPIHTMRGYKEIFKKKGDLKITEKLSNEIFSLPMYPDLSESKIEKVIRTINKF
jgi:dTDP-3-amino-2,3,6-trideoxy-4-keto-D-glucose/dTDP-3-amino-3,4,6-trideoxy-alpha-D-glucose/dTDP-2,6-dideoxy-D-kanosamine transaminase